MHKSGFVTIIGKPNVGKSTFVNHIVGEKIAITSHKPQTTRNAIRGIYNDAESQIIFIDTPGVHKPKHKLGATMTDTALNTMNAVDVIMMMISGLEQLEDIDHTIIERLKNAKTPAILVVNKIDAVKDVDRLEILINKYKSLHDFKGVFAISALNGIHTKLLMDDIKDLLEEGPKYYPEDQTTDNPIRFMISELIREKVLELTQEEIPHSVMVLIDAMENDDVYEHVLNIHASIIVERDSQKGIIIGKNGRMIKKIGTKARHDILALLGVKIYLDLHCKVEKNWRNKNLQLRNFGYHNDHD
jgi:GTP-binding protein Era